MSDHSGHDHDPVLSAMPVEAPRRAASLTLRSDEVRQSRAASMELANRSLADALRITYRLLQGLMLILLVLFAFSGVRRVEQAERGVKVALGRLADADLQPGMHFSLPYPLGEIRKVSTAQVQVNVDESFFPFLDANQRNLTIEQLGMGDALRPGKDGSLITGDGNLAHARFGVTYHRETPADLVQSLADGQEERLVRAVVERAAVRTIAEIPLDEVLKRNTGGGSSTVGTIGSEIEDRIRRTAQAALDELGTGLRIDAVLMRDETPPLRTRPAYQAVQTAESKAATDREKAEERRSAVLNRVAGAAYAPLLALIEEYGRALDAKDEASAEKVLAEIDALLTPGLAEQKVTVGGREFTRVKVAGAASQVVSEAESYRSSVVQSAKADAEVFRAKREQYVANPRVFITREWADAMKAFLSLDQVQTQFVPDSAGKYVLRLSEDPDIAREQRAAAQRRAIMESEEKRRGYSAGTLPGESAGP